ncbi:hypothetical protein HPB48_006371 [Haemaphysalis longicornis]|uniref:Uncharacterized protein n=1 Tax=Haemaphysalis longicornis TaxID=44386 RepID=A0A9J6FLH1_HAELO|nr:hypothetical protein HPB48_006371 [Haemaphysalis longicornis]
MFPLGISSVAPGTTRLSYSPGVFFPQLGPSMASFRARKLDLKIFIRVAPTYPAVALMHSRRDEHCVGVRAADGRLAWTRVNCGCAVRCCTEGACWPKGEGQSHFAKQVEIAPCFVRLPTLGVQASEPRRPAQRPPSGPALVTGTRAPSGDDVAQRLQAMLRHGVHLLAARFVASRVTACGFGTYRSDEAKEGDEAADGNAPALDAPLNTKGVALNEAEKASKAIHGEGNSTEEEKHGNLSTQELLDPNDDDDQATPRAITSTFTQQSDGSQAAAAHAGGDSNKAQATAAAAAAKRPRESPGLNTDRRLKQLQREWSKVASKSKKSKVPAQQNRSDSASRSFRL